MDASTVLTNILAIAADPKAPKRVQALIALENEAVTAEKTLASRRGAFEQRKTAVSAELSKMAGANERYSGEIETIEAAVAYQERRLIADEAAWHGIPTLWEATEQGLH